MARCGIIAAMKTRPPAKSPSGITPNHPPSRGAILLAPSGPGVRVMPIPQNPRALRKWAPEDRSLFEEWLGHLQAGRIGGKREG
jgi:hypothetical protein